MGTATHPAAHADDNPLAAVTEPHAVVGEGSGAPVHRVEVVTAAEVCRYIGLGVHEKEWVSYRFNAADFTDRPLKLLRVRFRYDRALVAPPLYVPTFSSGSWDMSLLEKS